MRGDDADDGVRSCASLYFFMASALPYFPFSFSVTGCWSNIYLSEMEPEPLIIYYELSAKLYIL